MSNSKTYNTGVFFALREKRSANTAKNKIVKTILTVFNTSAIINNDHAAGVVWQ